MTNRFFACLCIFSSCLGVLTATGNSQAKNYDDYPLISPILSTKEVKATEHSLKKVKTGAIPNGFDGGIIVEGTVQKLVSIDKFGRKTWLIQSENVLHGQELLPSSEFEVISHPKGKLGGVQLRIGERYRLFAVKFHANSHFSVWKGTVIKVSIHKK